MTAHILANGNWLTASVNRMKAKPVPLAVYINKAELNVIMYIKDIRKRLRYQVHFEDCSLEALW